MAEATSSGFHERQRALQQRLAVLKAAVGNWSRGAASGRSDPLTMAA
jgi:hypothetical protein